MRRFVILCAVFALAFGFVAGCEKESDVTGPGSVGDGEPGIPDALALAQNIPPLLANGEAQVTILATVVDGKQRGLEGIGVQFSTTHGTVEPFATTDSKGIARTVLTSAARSTDVTATVSAAASADTTGKPIPGGSVVVMSRTPLTDELLGQAVEARLHETEDGVTAAAAGGVVSHQTQVKMLGITLTSLAVPAVIPADGQSASRVRANLIETTSRIPLQGERIRFGASAGAITGNVATDATGTATALLTGTTSGTTSNITVYYGNQLTTTTSVSFSALTLTLAAGAAEPQPDGAWETAITATLVNAEQNPVSGVPIVFTSSSGAIPSPVLTNDKGVAAATLYHDAALPRSVTVNASFGEISRELLIDLDPTLVLALSAGQPELSEGSVYRTPIVARLANPDGNPLVGASVKFAAAQGTIPSPVVTNADGEARTTLISPATLDSDQVTATFGQAVQQLAVQFAFPAPAEVLLAADPGSLPADGGSQAVLTATVLDASGDPVLDGTAVTFSIVSGGGSIVAPVRATQNGVAEAIYLAGTESGFVTVKAAAGTAEMEALLTLTRLGVGGLSLSADADSVLADGYASATVTAVVTDVLGHPVAPGTVVNFTASQGVLEDVQPTNEQGEATVKLRASRYVTGLARVTARAGEYTSTVDVRFVSEAAAQIVVLDVDNPRIGIQGSGARESAVITLVVQDRNSIPVDLNHAVGLSYEIVAVDPFIVTDAVVDPVTAVSNERGRAVANVLSGIVAGAVEVRATAGAIVSQPIRVAIHGDLPDEAHFSLSFDRLNIAGLVYDGIRDPVTARVGDRYGNPVPDSTAVWFTTEKGIVQGSAFTNDHAEATVDLITAAPRPAIPGGNGLVLVTAQTVSKDGDRITTDGYVLWSGPTELEFTSPTQAAGFAVANGGIVTLNFRVSDANFNPLVSGTQIAVSSNDGVLGGQTDVELPDTQDSAAYTMFSVTISDDDADDDTLRSVTVTVTVTSENGNRTKFITGTMR